MSTRSRNRPGSSTIGICASKLIPFAVGFESVACPIGCSVSCMRRSTIGFLNETPSGLMESLTRSVAGVVATPEKTRFCASIALVVRKPYARLLSIALPQHARELRAGLDAEPALGLLAEPAHQSARAVNAGLA